MRSQKTPVVPNPANLRLRLLRLPENCFELILHLGFQQTSSGLRHKSMHQIGSLCKIDCDGAGGQRYRISQKDVANSALQSRPKSKQARLDRQLRMKYDVGYLKIGLYNLINQPNEKGKKSPSSFPDKMNQKANRMVM